MPSSPLASVTVVSGPAEPRVAKCSAERDAVVRLEQVCADVAHRAHGGLAATAASQVHGLEPVFADATPTGRRAPGRGDGVAAG